MDKRYFDFIDGLRALAVILVVLFHIDPKLISGGFIGVDIFFVISGFVITHAILKSRNKEGFKKFYFDFVKSRVRRLAPAFIFLLFVLSALNFVFMTADEFSSYIKSQISAVTFLSNIFFSQSVDYFAMEAKSLHLLHTWSLSVEWQFYFIFPVVLYCFKSYRAHHIALIVFLFALLGALANIIQTSIDSNESFYFTPYRFFQFFAGSLIYALYMQSGSFKYVFKKFYIQALFLLSFLAVIYWSFYLNEESIYPGVNSIIPTFAASLLIFSGLFLSEDSLANKFLLFKPVKWIGNASYSIYLWHWPVIIYLKMFLPKLQWGYYYSFAIIATFIASYISYEFVEKYFRYKNQKTFRLSVFALCGLFVISSTGYIFDTETKYVRKAIFENMSLLDEPGWTEFPGRCTANQEKDLYISCKIGDVEAKPHIVFYGDSQVQMLTWSLHKLLEKNGRSALVVAKGGCPPIAAFRDLKHKDNSSTACKNLFSILEDLLNKNDGLMYLVVSGRWNGYPERDYISHIDGQGNSSFQDSIIQSIDYWKKKGLKVLLVSDYPEPGFSIPSLRFRYAQLGLDIDKSYVYISNKNYLEAAAIKADYFFEPVNYLCNFSVCPTLIGSAPAHFDATHLSREASEKISKEIFSVLKDN